MPIINQLHRKIILYGTGGSGCNQELGTCNKLFFPASLFVVSKPMNGIRSKTMKGAIRGNVLQLFTEREPSIHSFTVDVPSLQATM